MAGQEGGGGGGVGGGGGESPAPQSPPAISSTCLDPVSAATLYDLEVSRRRARSRGPLVMRTGCREIDEEALLSAGFERGCVVGVSAEDVDFGVLIGLQTIAHSLVSQGAGNDDNDKDKDINPRSGRPRAAIITTLAVTAILPLLRDVIKAQVLSKLGPTAAQPGAVGAEVRACLECISISQVFDIEGLWEVITELEMPPSPPEQPVDREAGGGGGTSRSTSADEKGPAVEKDFSKTLPPAQSDQIPPQPQPAPAPPLPLSPLPLPSISPRKRPRARDKMDEIGDSEDEGEELSLASSSSSPLSPPPPSPPAIAAEPLPQPQPQPQPQPEPEPEPEPGEGQKENQPEEAKGEPQPNSHIPYMILITHFSNLLTTLFTQRDKTGAHAILNLLSSHLRYLARASSSSRPGPLIMLLNSTSPSPSPNLNTNTTTNPNNPQYQGPPQPPQPEERGPMNHHRPLDPTLRSIFNPPDHSTASTSGGMTAARRNKPAYGATFAQFLDLHLLCTRVPRGRADAEALVAPGPGVGMAGVRYAWVVEVLLDEVGVWEWRDGGGRVDGEKEVRWSRRCREQMWGAVDVRDGTRVVDVVLRGLGAGVGTRN